MTHLERIERIENEIRGVVSLYGITSWEREFLNNGKTRQFMTEKQLDILAGIEKKVFGGNKDD